MKLRVGCVVVTRNRRAIAEQAVRAAQSQGRPPESVFVVDNASTDDTEAAFRPRRDIVYIRRDDNGGYAAGLTTGIDAARSSGLNAYWLLDDDSRPWDGALERLAWTAACLGPRVGIVGLQGGRLSWRGIRHIRSRQELLRRPVAVSGARLADFTLVDGALLLEPAATITGGFRDDFFMMMEDIEYSWRLRRAGFEVVVLEEEMIDRGHLGSTGSRIGNPWRQYYQSRNHVRWAIESGSLETMLGAVMRQCRLVGANVRRLPARRAYLNAHLAGIRDGILGRMGRTVDPIAVARKDS
jgi:rhamnopyranosyl-N-acetylglucosaminyl-diphospho-decaprenol beta-1,3/1,4-galactofuranosyltransferase